VVTKTFSVDWDGSPTEVQYDDDISFGAMETIVKKCVDLSDITKPKVDMAAYRSSILLAVITKAPWNVADPHELKKLRRKTVERVILEVMKDYPLAACLEGWMTSFLGSVGSSDLKLTPTDSALPNSDGTKKPQTDNPQNGSKKQSQQQENSSKTQ